MYFPVKRILRAVAGLFFLCSLHGFAQGTFSLHPPTVGSGNVANADPPVIRPLTQPCKVQLFSGFEFTSFQAQTFSYSPPADCPGPWAKVVFAADFSVNGTNQFDRTAEIQLADTMIYFGTTQEPSATEQPSWHVESDLTDYTALFRSSQPGTMELGNTVNAQDNGVETVSAYLEFYPADLRNPSPRTADEVLPLPDLQQSPGAQKLEIPTDTIQQTFTLPTNVEAAYLDVFTQGQIDDEFWWNCGKCQATSFREAQISIDGRPAGLAPIYPYIFTGGLDPNLWRPIPGVQTLNLKPYRVDLTPFASLFSDGAPHTVAVSVYNAHHYFNADATLLVFEDHGAQKVTGDVVSNTLDGVIAPTVADGITNATSGGSSVMTTDTQSYQLHGYVNTSHGRVDTVVDNSLSFSNIYEATANSLHITQLTRATRRSNTIRGFIQTAEEQTLTYPLTFDSVTTMNPDKSESTTSSIDEGLTEDEVSSIFGHPIYSSHLTDHVTPVNTQKFDTAGTQPAASIDTSKETYTFSDTVGHCWSRVVSAKYAEVSDVQDGQGCSDGVNHWSDNQRP
jgi:hypothetical protein